MDEKLIQAHGGYRDLAAYQMAEIVHDATVAFTNLYIDRRSRTVDQMVQAARSGKQNIASEDGSPWSRGDSFETLPSERERKGEPWGRGFQR